MSDKNKETVIVGIDLGTTFSLVSVLQDGKPVLLSNGLGKVLTYSAVSVDDAGRLLVGAPARSRAVTHPDRTVLSFKRDMGTSRKFKMGKHSFTPEELSAAVLMSLKDDAETALGLSITEAVITVPAYFGDLQRQATRDAGTMAGLVVERIINEPTAAALAYGLNARDRDCHVAVLDLGGGTFDVTVLEIIDECIEVQSSAGDSRLGGDDFDEALQSWFLGQVAKTHGPGAADPRSMARIRQACELAKKRLSAGDSAPIAVAALHWNDAPIDVEITLTRDEAEVLWEPLVERIRIPVVRALRDAELQPENIDEVLLVGGATRMPCVSKLVTQVFGRLPMRNLPPDEAVAMGAAIQAGLKQGHAAVEDLVVTDVAPFTLGVNSSDQIGARIIQGIFSPVLERGTVIPASRVERFHTMNNYQREIEMKIYQGEHARCDRNRCLGSFTIKRLPKRKAGEVEIDVRFTYDLNGIIEVEASVVGTKKRETLVLEQRPGTLSRKELKSAVEKMQRIKFHPRESLPNTTAMARAEALYTELTGPGREILSEAIRDFNLALESQDPALIGEARQGLVVVTEDLR